MKCAGVLSVLRCDRTGEGQLGAGLTCLVGGWQDGGHVDAPGLQLMPQSFREEVERCFGCTVRCQARERLVTWKHRQSAPVTSRSHGPITETSC